LIGKQNCGIRATGNGEKTRKSHELNCVDVWLLEHHLYYTVVLFLKKMIPEILKGVDDTFRSIFA